MTRSLLLLLRRLLPKQPYTDEPLFVPEALQTVLLATNIAVLAAVVGIV